MDIVGNNVIGCFLGTEHPYIDIYITAVLIILKNSYLASNFNIPIHRTAVMTLALA